MESASQWSLADHEITDGCALTLIKHATPMILTASYDRTAKLWNSITGECTQTFSGHQHHVNSAVFSGDGSSVLTSSWDKTAKLWSSTTGECTQTFSGHQDVV